MGSSGKILGVLSSPGWSRAQLWEQNLSLARNHPDLIPVAPWEVLRADGFQERLLEISSELKSSLGRTSLSLQGFVVSIPGQIPLEAAFGSARQHQFCREEKLC